VAQEVPPVQEGVQLQDEPDYDGPDDAHNTALERDGERDSQARVGERRDEADGPRDDNYAD
jgi:hypothetical protein